MKIRLLEILICPSCKSNFKLYDDVIEGPELISGTLKCESDHAYDIINGVPYFAGESYADSFGIEWNQNKTTQHDSETKTNTYSRKFYSYTGWNSHEIEGKTVLEVGCGAGPFVEICSNAGAEIFAVDISNAVEACFQNHGRKENVHIIKADANNLPFPEEFFDYVFSIGVLHHTPNPMKTFASIQRYVKPKGKIAIWVYRKLIFGFRSLTYVLGKYIFRHLPPDTVYGIVERMVPVLLPVKRFVSKIPIASKFLRPLCLVADYDGIYDLSREDLFRWSVLDTFDRLTPKHQSSHTPGEVKNWFTSCGLVYINENNTVIGNVDNYKGFKFAKKNSIAVSAQKP